MNRHTEAGTDPASRADEEGGEKSPDGRTVPTHEEGRDRFRAQWSILAAEASRMSKSKSSNTTSTGTAPDTGLVPMAESGSPSILTT